MGNNKIKNLIVNFSLIKESFNDENYDQSFEEIKLLFPEFLEELFIQGRISDIEVKMADYLKFDIDAINNALGVFDQIKLSDKKKILDGKEFKLSDILSRAKNRIQEIEKAGEEWSRLEVSLRLEMFLDSDFEYLLISCVENRKLIQKIESQVFEKLGIFPRHEILLLWAKIKSLFQGDQSEGVLKQYEDITPKGFWKTTNVEETRKKCAEFMVSKRPAIIKRMQREGFLSFRVGPLGVARALSNKENVSQVTNMDFLVVRNISELIAKFHGMTNIKIEDLARGIGKSPESLVFKGEFLQSAKKSISLGKITKEKLSDFLYGMQKAANYIQIPSVMPTDTDLIEYLQRYKLGHEVVAPQNTETIQNGGEIKLQRELCRFLLERGIHCYGKSFGRSEIDLYVENFFGEDFVIEAKLYKEPPSEGELQKNLVQLFSYMDQWQKTPQARGVLALYNCSDSLIMAPRGWFKDRVYIFAINIGAKSPSKRRNRIKLSEGRDGQLLVVKD